MTVVCNTNPLLFARTRGFLLALRPELERLRAAGMWITEAWYQRLCQDEDTEVGLQDHSSA